MRRAAVRALFALLAGLLLLPGLSAQARDERTASPGVRAHLEQLVLPGSELEAKPADRKAPVMLRVLATWPHGSARRYDLEWTGFEPGKYDLAQYLVRKDGTQASDLPAIGVEVTALLPPGQVLPGALPVRDPPRYGSYWLLMGLFAVAWVAGLVVILFVGRRRRLHAIAVAAPPRTLADRLRPMVEAAAAGRLDVAGKADLERLLLAFWRERLGLTGTTAAAAMVVLRAHPEAGALLRQLEAWLHVPVPAPTIDVAVLLAPYRDVAADALEVAG